MKHLTIKTSAEERNAVMRDYGIEPAHTGWTLSERNQHTWQIAELCRTRRQARALWLDMFADLIEEYRTTDQAILEAEAKFIRP